MYAQPRRVCGKQEAGSRMERKGSGNEDARRRRWRMTESTVSDVVEQKTQEGRSNGRKANPDGGKDLKKDADG
ncbi:hypothetical protein CVT26_009720 [Gymnopilus dilepis]|uniref:Uncharacterized protein n=1 Tax=Gymnopilus dilepis TaxID=231916 RepID=A0A409YBG7_9AGAR|nr:hypothetical protein CVT26_009720 [Gymnopilus dilepis]